MSLEIRRLEDALIRELNSAQIDIEVKRLIVQDILHLVTKEADKQIANEIKSTMSESEEKTE